MPASNDPWVKPKDATEATEEQRVIQDQLEHSDDDPEAPGGHQDRHDIADENGR